MKTITNPKWANVFPDGEIRVGMELEYDDEDGHYVISELIQITRLGFQYQVISAQDHEEFEFQFVNGHSCWGKEIQGIISYTCRYCGTLSDTQEEREGCGCSGALEARHNDKLANAGFNLGRRK